jgi:hypothetical protein
LSTDATGNRTVRITGAQGSGVLRSMSEADCFIVLAHDQENIQAGDRWSGFIRGLGLKKPHSKDFEAKGFKAQRVMKQPYCNATLI